MLVGFLPCLVFGLSVDLHQAYSPLKKIDDMDVPMPCEVSPISFQSNFASLLSDFHILGGKLLLYKTLLFNVNSNYQRCSFEKNRVLLDLSSIKSQAVITKNAVERLQALKLKLTRAREEAIKETNEINTQIVQFTSQFLTTEINTEFDLKLLNENSIKNISQSDQRSLFDSLRKIAGRGGFNECKEACKKTCIRDCDFSCNVRCNIYRIATPRVVN